VEVQAGVETERLSVGGEAMVDDLQADPGATLRGPAAGWFSAPNNGRTSVNHCASTSRLNGHTVSTLRLLGGDPRWTLLRGQRAAIRSTQARTDRRTGHVAADLRKRNLRLPNNHDGVIAADAIRHGAV
jgi:hypothetical protein